MADEKKGMRMNIGNAARRSGVPPKTIRYYESTGLIRCADRDNNGYRLYDETDVQTLRFIKRARSLGFSVEEVASLLELWRDRDRKSADVQALALGRINQIELKVDELKSLKFAVKHLMENCQGDQKPDCPIIDELSGDDLQDIDRDGRAPQRSSRNDPHRDKRHLVR